MVHHHLDPVALEDLRSQRLTDDGVTTVIGVDLQRLFFCEDASIITVVVGFTVGRVGVVFGWQLDPLVKENEIDDVGVVRAVSGVRVPGCSRAGLAAPRGGPEPCQQDKSHERVDWSDCWHALGVDWIGAVCQRFAFGQRTGEHDVELVGLGDGWCDRVYLDQG